MENLTRVNEIKILANGQNNSYYKGFNDEKLKELKEKHEQKLKQLERETQCILSTYSNRIEKNKVENTLTNKQIQTIAKQIENKRKEISKLKNAPKCDLNKVKQIEAEIKKLHYDMQWWINHWTQDVKSLQKIYDNILKSVDCEINSANSKIDKIRIELIREKCLEFINTLREQSEYAEYFSIKIDIKAEEITIQTLTNKIEQRIFANKDEAIAFALTLPKCKYDNELSICLAINEKNGTKFVIIDAHTSEFWKKHGKWVKAETLEQKKEIEKFWKFETEDVNTITTYSNIA